MKKIYHSDIKNLWLSVEISNFFAEDWSGTALDVLDVKHLPDSDKLWIVINDKFISTEILDKFAEQCNINVDGIKTSKDRARYALWKSVWNSVNESKRIAANHHDANYASIQMSGTLSLKLSYKIKVTELREILTGLYQFY